MPVEPTTFGDAGQCVKTVCSVEEGPGTFAFAGTLSDGGDGASVSSGLGPLITPIIKLPRSPTAPSHPVTKEVWTSSCADMAIPNGPASEAIDDTIDFSDLEAK